MTATSPPLDRPLPPEVVTHIAGGPASYRRYPVFSAPWLRKRSLVFGAFAAMIGVLSGLGLGMEFGDWSAAGLVAVHSGVTFAAMMIAGPALATFVRHRRLRARLERPLVIGAVIVGMAVSYVADSYASAVIEIQLEQRMRGNAKFERLNVKKDDHPLAGRLIAITFGLSIYFMLGGGLALRAYLSEDRRLTDVRRERELADLRAARQQADLRLAVLQAQVEPHFLFNTLASTRSLIRTDAARAEHMIDALVDYLRATIPKLRDAHEPGHATLGEQLALCESYLKLMRVRMGERLDYAVDVDATLAAQAFPPLILISLVENAIKHGVEPKRGPGRIDVRARLLDAGTLQVTVTDTGVGLRAGFGNGVGLANIREQLLTRFGERARLTLSGPPEGGARATIEIPINAT